MAKGIWHRSQFGPSRPRPSNILVPHMWVWSPRTPHIRRREPLVKTAI